MSQVLLGIYGVVSYEAPNSTRATWGTLANGVYSGAGPALTTFNAVRSVTLTLDDGEADATTRGSAPWKLTAQALTDAEIEIEALWKPSDAGFQQFLQAKLTRVSIPVAILDQLQATSGAQGLWGDFAVMGFTREEAEDKEMVAKIKLKPTIGPANLATQWVAVP